MRFIVIIIFIFLAFYYNSKACTTFVLEDENTLLFGRNLDWVSENGIIVENKRGVQKTSLVFPPEIPISWVSKFGSVTFNQFGKEFPFGGMNEKGLVIEIMRAPAQYPSSDKRPAANELQWIQYQLDNFSTIDEVIASDEILRINAVEQQLHYLVCDASGNTAVIEFVKGEMVVYKNEELPHKVLENDPYNKSLKKLEDNFSCRFKKVVDGLKEFESTTDVDPIEYAFDILDNVKLDGSWSIVYDIKNQEIYFKTAENKQIQSFSFDTFNFNCQHQSMGLSISSKNSGEVNGLFNEITHAWNDQIMRDAMEKNQINFPSSVKEIFLNYHLSCGCTDDE